MDEQPPIPFYASRTSDKQQSATKADKNQSFKHTNPNDANVITKVDIPIYKSTHNAEDLLRTVQAFRDATSTLEWATGP